MAEIEPIDTEEPLWRQRAVSRSLNAARSRAEQRVQRFLDAAFELIDEKGTTEFTIQEVVDRSKQSLRSFYEYFDGKDELVLALFEETIREADDDIRTAVEAESDPLDRLLVSTARHLDAVFLTADRQILEYASETGNVRVHDASR